MMFAATKHNETHLYGRLSRILTTGDTVTATNACPDGEAALILEKALCAAPKTFKFLVIRPRLILGRALHRGVRVPS